MASSTAWSNYTLEPARTSTVACTASLVSPSTLVLLCIKITFVCVLVRDVYAACFMRRCRRGCPFVRPAGASSTWPLLRPCQSTADGMRTNVVSNAPALKESRRLLGNEFRYNVRATFLGVSEGGELVQDDPDKALRDREPDNDKATH